MTFFRRGQNQDLQFHFSKNQRDQQEKYDLKFSAELLESLRSETVKSNSNYILPEKSTSEF